MLGQGLVMTRLGANARGQQVEEISRLGHEMVEASSSLKQSLETNSTYKGKLARAAAKGSQIEEGLGGSQGRELGVADRKGFG